MNILSIIFITLSVYIIYQNWKSFYYQTIEDEPYPSIIPFLGGIFLCFSLIVFLPHYYKLVSILAFFIDYGSITVFLHHFITKNHKKHLSILGIKISLLSKKRKNKELIYNYLSQFDDKTLEQLFYHLFEKNKESKFINYEKNLATYHISSITDEITNLFLFFHKLQIGRFYLQINSNEKNPNCVGYYKINKHHNKPLILNKNILEDWNKNIFTELICSIFICNYKQISEYIIKSELNT